PLHRRLAHRQHHLLGLLPHEVPGSDGLAPRAPARLPPDGRAHVHPADGLALAPALRRALRRGPAPGPRRGGGGGGSRGESRRRGTLAAAERRGENRSMVRRLVAVAVVVVGFAGGVARAELAPGTMLQQSNADQANGLLPPEILKHYKAGDYMNQIVD